MASATAILNEKTISMFGVGVSLADIFKLLMTYWSPDSALGKQVKGQLSAALAANNAQMLCELLNADGFTAAINQGLAQVLAAKIQAISGAFGQCNINCSTGSIDVDIVGLIFDTAIAAFGVDGIDVAGLAKNLIAQVVCCALTAGLNFAISKANPLQLLGAIRAKCKKALGAGGSSTNAALAQTMAASYGQTPETAVAKSKKLVKTRRGWGLLLGNNTAAESSFTPLIITAAGTVAVSSIILYRRGKLPWLRRRR